mmetsp:Transcript_49085/g.116844  ORF Transcript_49085/g.116844 Transcript_49085/m.116844 type:complete len:621 (+) Transcript_49085:47-1909(+)
MDDVCAGFIRKIGEPLPRVYRALTEAKNGLLYAVPEGAGRVIEIDPASGRVQEIGSPLRPSRHGPSYEAMAMASNGRLYAPPGHARRVLEIDPATGSVEHIGPDFGVPGDPEQEHYLSIAAGANGRLYAPPAGRGHVLEIDPVKGTVSRLGDVEDQKKMLPFAARQYVDIVLAQNGSLYSPPFSADWILEINPSSGSVKHIGGPDEGPIEVDYDEKYARICQASNGNLYAVHYLGISPLEITPSTGKVKRIGTTFGETGYQGLPAVVDGQIIWACSDTKHLLELDTTRGQYIEHPLTDFLASRMPERRKKKSSMMESDIVLAGNGRLYILPSRYCSHLLEFDPEVKRARILGGGCPAAGYRPIVVSSGRVFALPDQADFPIIQVDYNSLPSSGCKVLQSLRTALADGDLSDVVVRTSDGQTYRAHKLILALRSQVFRRMFGTKMRETQDGLVDLGDVSARAADLFMRYVYSEQPKVWRMSIEELCDLSSLAHRFEVDDLVSACARLLQSSIGINNAAHLLRLADLWKLRDLKEACLDYIVANACTVMDTDEWEEVPAALAREVAEAMSGRRSKRPRLTDREFAADTDWTKLTLPKLRRACTERGLPQDGDKESLVERLMA